MSKGNPSYLSPPGFNYIKGSKRKVSAAGAHDPHYQVLMKRLRSPLIKNSYISELTLFTCQVTSFRDINFESEEMKRLLNMGIPDFIEKKGILSSRIYMSLDGLFREYTVGPEIKYDSNALMPDWIINNPDWKRTRCDNNDNNLISGE